MTTRIVAKLITTPNRVTGLRKMPWRKMETWRVLHCGAMRGGRGAASQGGACLEGREAGHARPCACKHFPKAMLCLPPSPPAVKICSLQTLPPKRTMKMCQNWHMTSVQYHAAWDSQ